MPNSPATALIVDDDVIARQMMAFGLEAAGFACSHAIDGNDALVKIGQRNYDLVVTDLKMPGRNGHSLAIELLHHPLPPLIAVHTSVDDPRMAQDLMTRGVDDIVYKPANYAAFAGKMKGLVSRRRGNNQRAPGALGTSHNSKSVSAIELADLQQRLRDAKHILPISDAGFELSSMLSQEGTAMADIVKVIERDAALCCEVIRIANQAGNLAGRPKVVDLKEAIGVVGTKQISLTAVVVSALRTFTGAVLPWLDPDTARRQGVAAQIALTHLCRQGNWELPDDGLTISALVHPMGRALLGALFPRHYQHLLAMFAEQGETFSEIERSIFPVSHTAALAELLCGWNVPPETVQPLRHAADSFASVARLAEPLQQQVLRLKTAIVVGQCAAGQWHPWDTIEFPPQAVLKKFKVPSAEQLIDDVARELKANEPQATAVAGKKTAVSIPSSKISYCNLSVPESDFLTSVLSSIGRPDALQTKDSRMMRRGTVINCVGASSSIQLDPQDVKRRELILVTDGDLPLAISQVGHAIHLPASYQALTTACMRVAAPH